MYERHRGVDLGSGRSFCLLDLSQSGLVVSPAFRGHTAFRFHQRIDAVLFHFLSIILGDDGQEHREEIALRYLRRDLGTKDIPFVNVGLKVFKVRASGVVSEEIGPSDVAFKVPIEMVPEQSSPEFVSVQRLASYSFSCSSLCQIHAPAKVRP